MQHREEAWAKLLIWFIPAMWAVNYFCARLALGVIGPYVLALGRWLLAGLVLAYLARHELHAQRMQIQKDWAQHLVLGFLGMLICGAWVYWGALTTTAINIALIYAAAPVLIALGSAIWLREKLTRLQLLGIALALAGVLHVVLRGHWSALLTLQWSQGDLLIVVATVSWAAFALLQKKWISVLGASARLACICAGGVLTLLPFAVWEWLQPDNPAWSWRATELVLAVALIPGVGAYWIYSWAQRVLGASRTSVSLYLGPLWGAVVSWGLLGEPLGWFHAAGGALIVTGVALVTRSKAP